MESPEGRRILVIGLDGGTFDLIHPLAAAGKLPNLSRMMERGSWGKLRSTTPPHSAPAWASFATGANPGRHGIYHFRPIDRRFYEGNFSRVINARSIALPTLWARASRAGKRVGVINVPITYPPEPVNGFIISGMLTPPSAPAFTFPPELSAELKDYVIDVDTGVDDDVLEQKNLQTAEGLAWLARSLEHQLAVRTRTALQLFERYQPDLAVVVFTETDRLHHYFWPCLDTSLEPPPHLQPYQTWAWDFYARLDAAIGQLVGAMGKETVQIVLSDHGFGPYPQRQFYANAWLRDQGLLQVRSDSVRSTPARLLSRLGLSQSALHQLLARFLPRHQVQRLRVAWGKRMRQPIDWTASQAYFMPLFDFVGGMIVNQPAGSSAYEETRTTLLEALQGLVDPETGVHVVTEVHRREDIYSGPYAGRAPDLVFVLDPNYVGDRSLLTKSWFGTMAGANRQWTGTHRFDGILVMAGPPVKAGGKSGTSHMQDVAPTALHLLGMPVPNTMDGHVLEEMLTPDFMALHPVRLCQEEESAGGPAETGWDSAEDEAQVVERLQSLGYIE